MTKAQKEKIERLKLKQMLDTQPKMKEIIDKMIENPKPEIVDAVKPVIEEALKKERMIGVNIGFYGGLIQAYEKVKGLDDAETIKKMLLNEANKVKDKFSLNKTNE